MEALVKKPRLPDRDYLTGAIIGMALVVSSCDDNSDRLANMETPKAASKTDLFLSPMQSEGIQYVAAYGKQLHSSEDALKRVKKVMEAYLFDPDTAQYRNLRVGRDGSVCGSYNAKNRYAAYVGYRDFVLTSDGRVVTSDASGGIAASSDTSYVNAYLDACGTKAQIAAYRTKPESSSQSDSTELDANTTEQEPDEILDAPPTREPPSSPPDIPTA